MSSSSFEILPIIVDMGCGTFKTGFSSEMTFALLVEFYVNQPAVRQRVPDVNVSIGRWPSARYDQDSRHGRERLLCRGWSIGESSRTQTNWFRSSETKRLPSSRLEGRFLLWNDRWSVAFAPTSTISRNFCITRSTTSCGRPLKSIRSCWSSNMHGGGMNYVVRIWETCFW